MLSAIDCDELVSTCQGISIQLKLFIYIQQLLSHMQIPSSASCHAHHSLAANIRFVGIPLETMASTAFPVVNLEDLYNLEEVSFEDERCQRIAEEFGAALHNWGFAYLKNHGIPKTLIEEAFVESKKFFELSPEVKAKYAKEDVTKNYHGYNQPGNEQLDLKSVELREAFDITGNDRFYPKELPEFKEKIEALESACKHLDKKLLNIMAIALGLDDINFFLNQTPQLDDRSIPHVDTFRTLYYPSVPDNVPEGAVRCAAHTDYGTCTLLFQDEIGGLEVRGATNEWVDAAPIADTIVVNVGDLLELWTCGYFPATEHRVRIPEEEKRKHSVRQSMAFFLHPANDVVVEALSIPGRTTNTSRYKGPVVALEHLMNKVKATYGVYS